MISYETIRHLGYMVFVVLCMCFISCQNANEQTQVSSSADKMLLHSGTAEMIDSLRAVYNRTQFFNNPYSTAENVAVLEQMIEKAKASGRSLETQFYIQYAFKLLEAGRTEEAIAIFQKIKKDFDRFKTLTGDSKTMYETLAIAYMRLGEQQNCILNHSDESCIFPIQGKGIHTKKEGSQKAIEYYKAILTKYPKDLQSRWLLNLAYMTIGEYPQSVPRQWLIPASSYASEYPLPKFDNIASGLKLDINNLAGGVIADDMNNDGLIDIVASSWGLKDQLRFFQNTGEGTFEEMTQSAGLMGLTGGLNLKPADFNNDGKLDFIVLRGAWNPLNIFGTQPNSLIRNNGDGTFSDVTIAAGLYAIHPTQAACWLDFDRDGWIDIFIANETHLDRELHPCEFYKNNGDGTFSEISAQLGLNITGLFKGVAAADVNNDGWPDIYLPSMNGPNKLFVNQPGQAPNERGFKESSAAARVQLPNASFPAWVFDFNNDGWEDIFVAPFDEIGFKRQAWDVSADMLSLPRGEAESPALYQNNGDGTFTNVAKQQNLERALHTMGCNFGDIDNDGFLDFYLGTGAPDFRSIVPNRMFRNNAGKNFQDVTTVGRFGHIQKGHAIGFADFDNDGDQDIYAVMGGSFSGDIFQNAFFLNPGNDNKWVNIILKGTTSNAAAIGARIRLNVRMANDKARQIHNTVNSGASFGGNSLQQEIGLGDAKAIESLAINWPNRNNQYVSYGSIPLNATAIITEGNPEPLIKHRTLIKWKLSHTNHHHH